MKKFRPKSINPRMNRLFSSGRYRLYKINVRKIRKGIIYIQASRNNTIITVTDFRGQVVSWDSAGASRFKGPKRGTPYAAQIATRNAIYMVVKQGMIETQLRIKGAGPGRDAALRTVLRSGVKVKCIRDVTPFPHNGCRATKKRRV
uniref:Small ribosomal subunit protein uS11c n=1 Tax=Juncus effusus TaxID=13579 RepID=A0A8A3SPF8_JUNEF|nr:ribosomal protein S11 [Juncus effusus]QSZ78310.1 ribosomal protein S11 [Juncus effusus]